jgi:hypothetical protein
MGRGPGLISRNAAAEKSAILFRAMLQDGKLAAEDAAAESRSFHISNALTERDSGNCRPHGRPARTSEDSRIDVMGVSRYTARGRRAAMK